MTEKYVPNMRQLEEETGHGDPAEHRYGPFAHGRRWRVQVRIGNKRRHQSFATYDEAVSFVNVGCDSLVAMSASLIRRAATAQSSRDGWVYMIATDPNKVRRIKVGFTSKLKKRFADYRTASPHALLLAAWEAFRGDEATAHAALDGRIGNSEVFLVRDLQKSIRSLDDLLGDRLPPIAISDGSPPALLTGGFATASQARPRPNRETAIADLVISDVRSRQVMGRQRYGTDLQPHNGRDALVDAYQEAVDLAMYLRQLLEERSKSMLANHNRRRKSRTTKTT